MLFFIFYFRIFRSLLTHRKFLFVLFLVSLCWNVLSLTKRDFQKRFWCLVICLDLGKLVRLGPFHHAFIHIQRRVNNMTIQSLFIELVLKKYQLQVLLLISKIIHVCAWWEKSENLELKLFLFALLYWKPFFKFFSFEIILIFSLKFWSDIRKHRNNYFMTIFILILNTGIHVTQVDNDRIQIHCK